MIQEKVTRKELEEMRVGSSRIFNLIDGGKVKSALTTCQQMKNEGRGDWTVRKDYESTSVSITRNK